MLSRAVLRANAVADRPAGQEAPRSESRAVLMMTLSRLRSTSRTGRAVGGVRAERAGLGGQRSVQIARAVPGDHHRDQEDQRMADVPIAPQRLPPASLSAGWTRGRPRQGNRCRQAQARLFPRGRPLRRGPEDDQDQLFDDVVEAVLHPGRHKQHGPLPHWMLDPAGEQRARPRTVWNLVLRCGDWSSMAPPASGRDPRSAGRCAARWAYPPAAWRAPGRASSRLAAQIAPARLSPPVLHQIVRSQRPDAQATQLGAIMLKNM